ncbi:MAG: hypothetical protein CVU47_03060 [Chloroflexi bacterium HGW-Chloroflexi-9]|nr:MAG: hypothetical protein CVU47_03060 [Chloroflexi bacterium HGW-Chloroflexi-9]
MPALSRVIFAGLIALLATEFVTGSVATAAAPGELAFPAPIGTRWEVLAGYNTSTHEGVDSYALDLWRLDGPTAGTPLLSPISGTLGYMSDTCISVRTVEVNLLMCHVHALPGLQRGAAIITGQRLGTVADDGEAGNGGTAHIHLQLNARSGQSTGASLPFADAYRLDGVSLPAISTFNGYAGTRFTSTNDPALAVASVFAGIDHSVEAGSLVTLTATGQNIDEYAWIQTEGPLLTLLTNGVSTTFVAPADVGTVVTLQIFGGGPLGVASDEVRVTTRAALGPERGTLVAGSVWPHGLSLVVFGGGTSEELVLAGGCTAPQATYWASSGGRLIGYLPTAPFEAVNAGWLALFPDGLPANTPVLVSCG